MDVTDLVWVDSTGYHYADYPTFLQYVIQGYQNIYGADVYLGADSMDGQWMAFQAQYLYDTAAVGVAIYNSFPPTTAQGVGLSRVVKINGLSREIATNSTVDLTIVGVAGTTITNGIAVDTLNQQWALPSTVTIPGGGSIVVTATSVTIGAIAAAANTVTGIFTPTLGWQTVNNVSAASVGAPVESDAALRQRQAVSTAGPSLTVLEGTTAAVANVTGVTAVKPYENPTNTTDGNGLPPHSFSLVVEGGDADAIASAIALHKTPGTQTYGTTSVDTVDANGVPIVINFYRPTPAEIGVQVTITVLAGWDSSTETLIQNAVSAAVLAFGIGGDILYTQLYIAAYLVGTPQGSTFTIVSIEINKNGGSFAAANIQLLFNEIPTCNPSTDVTIIT